MDSTKTGIQSMDPQDFYVRSPTEVASDISRISFTLLRNLKSWYHLSLNPRYLKLVLRWTILSDQYRLSAMSLCSSAYLDHYSFSLISG